MYEQKLGPSSQYDAGDSVAYCVCRKNDAGIELISIPATRASFPESYQSGKFWTLRIAF